MGSEEAGRVDVTARAADLLRSLRQRYGAVMFHHSDEHCGGSAPMCYPSREFHMGGNDVCLGSLSVSGVPEPVEVWMSGAQFEYWQHTHLTIDVVAGRGSGFSLEAPDGLRFLLRPRLPDEEELSDL